MNVVYIFDTHKSLLALIVLETLLGCLNHSLRHPDYSARAPFLVILFHTFTPRLEPSRIMHHNDACWQQNMWPRQYCHQSFAPSFDTGATGHANTCRIPLQSESSWRSAISPLSEKMMSLLQCMSTKIKAELQCLCSPCCFIHGE